MRCHTCEMDDYVETKKEMHEPMGDGETECIMGTVLDCPTCHAQAIKIPANLLKRHAEALCTRPRRLKAANIAWLRKSMSWTQQELGKRLGGIAANTVYRWESGMSPMPASAEFLLRMLAAVDFELPINDIAAALPRL